MKQGWERKKLKDCFKLKSGDGLTAKQMIEGPYPVYGGNSQAGTHNQYNLSGDNVIVGRVGALCGNTRHITENIWLTDNAFKITNKAFSFENDFLTYLLNYKNLRSLARQAAQPVISNSSLSELELDFPVDVNEQKRIVAILDQAFADIEQARALTEKNLKNARELFESYLQQVFSQRGEGWCEKPLHAVCSFLNGFAFKSKDSVQDSNTQLIRMGNLYKNKLDLKRKPSFYPENFGQEYNRYTLKQGDLIISLTGTVGKEDYGFTVEIPKTEKTLLLNQRIAKIIDVDSLKVDRKFLYRILRSKSFMESLYASAKGTRQANLSTSTMGEILIPLPRLEEQKIFCLNLDVLESQVEELQQKYIKKLALTDELKKSLLHLAFTGELTAKSAA